MRVILFLSPVNRVRIKGNYDIQTFNFRDIGK